MEYQIFCRKLFEIVVFSGLSIMLVETYSMEAEHGRLPNFRRNANSQVISNSSSCIYAISDINFQTPGNGNVKLSWKKQRKETFIHTYKISIIPNSRKLCSGNSPIIQEYSTTSFLTFHPLSPFGYTMCVTGLDENLDPYCLEGGSSCKTYNVSRKYPLSIEDMSFVSKVLPANNSLPSSSSSTSSTLRITWSIPTSWYHECQLDFFLLQNNIMVPGNSSATPLQSQIVRPDVACDNRGVCNQEVQQLQPDANHAIKMTPFFKGAVVGEPTTILASTSDGAGSPLDIDILKNKSNIIEALQFYPEQIKSSQNCTITGKDLSNGISYKYDCNHFEQGTVPITYFPKDGTFHISVTACFLPGYCTSSEEKTISTVDFTEVTSAGPAPERSLQLLNKSEKGYTFKLPDHIYSGDSGNSRYYAVISNEIPRHLLNTEEIHSVISREGQGRTLDNQSYSTDISSSVPHTKDIHVVSLNHFVNKDGVTLPLSLMEKLKSTHVWIAIAVQDGESGKFYQITDFAGPFDATGHLNGPQKLDIAKVSYIAAGGLGILILVIILTLYLRSRRRVVPEIPLHRRNT